MQRKKSGLEACLFLSALVVIKRDLVRLNSNQFILVKLSPSKIKILIP